MFYLVQEYYLNETPARELEGLFWAASAIDAIRQRPFWKHSSDFTSTNATDKDATKRDNAHTQDGNGKNGCQAQRLTFREFVEYDLKDWLASDGGGTRAAGDVAEMAGVFESQDPTRDDFFSPDFGTQYAARLWEEFHREEKR